MTNTAKHTQWRYEPETKTIRSEPTNYWIASMNSFEGAVDHEANARLIAAAPELKQNAERNLYALKEALKLIKIINPEAVLTVTLESQIEETTAAIAKARGQS